MGRTSPACRLSAPSTGCLLFDGQGGWEGPWLHRETALRTPVLCESGLCSLYSVVRTAMWVCGLHPKVHTKSSLHLLYSAFASEPPKQHEYGARYCTLLTQASSSIQLLGSEAQVTAQQCASSQRAAAPTPARKSETPPGGPGPKVRTWSLAS